MGYEQLCAQVDDLMKQNAALKSSLEATRVHWQCLLEWQGALQAQLGGGDEDSVGMFLASGELSAAAAPRLVATVPPFAGGDAAEQARELQQTRAGHDAAQEAPPGAQTCGRARLNGDSQQQHPRRVVSKKGEPREQGEWDQPLFPQGAVSFAGSEGATLYYPGPQQAAAHGLGWGISARPPHSLLYDSVHPPAGTGLASAKDEAVIVLGSVPSPLMPPQQELEAGLARNERGGHERLGPETPPPDAGEGIQGATECPLGGAGQGGSHMGPLTLGSPGTKLALRPLAVLGAEVSLEKRAVGQGADLGLAMSSGAGEGRGRPVRGTSVALDLRLGTGAGDGGGSSMGWGEAVAGAGLSLGPGAAAGEVAVDMLRSPGSEAREPAVLGQVSRGWSEDVGCRSEGGGSRLGPRDGDHLTLSPSGESAPEADRQAPGGEAGAGCPGGSLRFVKLASPMSEGGEVDGAGTQEPAARARGQVPVTARHGTGNGKINAPALGLSEGARAGGRPTMGAGPRPESHHRLTAAGRSGAPLPQPPVSACKDRPRPLGRGMLPSFLGSSLLPGSAISEPKVAAEQPSSGGMGDGGCVLQAGREGQELSHLAVTEKSGTTGSGVEYASPAGHIAAGLGAAEQKQQQQHRHQDRQVPAGTWPAEEPGPDSGQRRLASKPALLGVTPRMMSRHLGLPPGAPAAPLGPRQVPGPMSGAGPWLGPGMEAKGEDALPAHAPVGGGKSTSRSRDSSPPTGRGPEALRGPAFPEGVPPPGGLHGLHIAPGHQHGRSQSPLQSVVTGGCATVQSMGGVPLGSGLAAGGSRGTPPPPRHGVPIMPQGPLSMGVHHPHTQAPLSFLHHPLRPAGLFMGQGFFPPWGPPPSFPPHGSGSPGIALAPYPPILYPGHHQSLPPPGLDAGARGGIVRPVPGRRPLPELVPGSIPARHGTSAAGDAGRQTQSTGPQAGVGKTPPSAALAVRPMPIRVASAERPALAPGHVSASVAGGSSGARPGVGPCSVPGSGGLAGGTAAASKTPLDPGQSSGAAARPMMLSAAAEARRRRKAATKGKQIPGRPVLPPVSPGGAHLGHGSAASSTRSTPSPTVGGAHSPGELHTRSSPLLPPVAAVPGPGKIYQGSVQGKPAGATGGSS